MEMKRVWDMRIIFYQLNLRSSACEPLVKKLNKIMVCPTYLNSKEGCLFIAFVMTLDTKLLMVIIQ